MTENEDRVKCNKICCDANMGRTCMWAVNQRLIDLAKIPTYGMCEYLRREVLKRQISSRKTNEYLIGRNGGEIHEEFIRVDYWW